jgi:hypothetical protein
LNATASAFFGEVRSLFKRTCDACGPETAIFLFNEAAKAGRKQPPRKHCWATLPFPAMGKVNGADQRQICIWYEKLCEPKASSEKATFARIWERYLEFGGTTDAIADEIFRLKPPPPKKRKGPNNSEKDIQDRAIWDEDNPDSEWSKAKREGLSKQEFAARRFGKGTQAEQALHRRKYLISRARRTGI